MSGQHPQPVTHHRAPSGGYSGSGPDGDHQWQPQQQQQQPPLRLQQQTHAHQRPQPPQWQDRTQGGYPGAYDRRPGYHRHGADPQQQQQPIFYSQADSLQSEHASAAGPDRVPSYGSTQPQQHRQGQTNHDRDRHPYARDAYATRDRDIGEREHRERDYGGGSREYREYRDFRDHRDRERGRDRDHGREQHRERYDTAQASASSAGHRDYRDGRSSDGGYHADHYGRRRSDTNPHGEEDGYPPQYPGEAHAVTSRRISGPSSSQGSLSGAYGLSDASGIMLPAMGGAPPAAAGPLQGTPDRVSSAPPGSASFRGYGATPVSAVSSSSSEASASTMMSFLQQQQQQQQSSSHLLVAATGSMISLPGSAAPAAQAAAAASSVIAQLPQAVEEWVAKGQPAPDSPLMHAAAMRYCDDLSLKAHAETQGASRAVFDAEISLIKKVADIQHARVELFLAEQRVLDCSQTLRRLEK